MYISITVMLRIVLAKTVIQYILVYVSLGVSWSECEADDWPPCSTRSRMYFVYVFMVWHVGKATVLCFYHPLSFFSLFLQCHHFKVLSSISVCIKK
jgi:hypothetical protein